METRLKFIDLFSGIGGFRLAFDRAGYQCISSYEINSACRQVYQSNFGDIPELDVTQIQPHSLPDFDVLTAGFPCQPFSICGKRKGFEDTRGSYEKIFKFNPSRYCIFSTSSINKNKWNELINKLSNI